MGVQELAKGTDCTPAALADLRRCSVLVGVGREGNIVASVVLGYVLRAAANGYDSKLQMRYVLSTGEGSGGLPSKNSLIKIVEQILALIIALLGEDRDE